MAIHVVEEANRCLQCKIPRCQQGCPIHTNVPKMIRLFKESQVEEAAQMLFENNPLSVVCSLVCDHASQCEGHCVLGIKGEPVHISSIENYISDSALERVQIPQKPYNGMKAAVIGAGPAGITISMILASRGYKVTLFESRDKIGGIMRYGIPEFRLPHSILDRIALKMKELGILYRPNFSIGGNVTLTDLLKDGYKSIFIGTGAWRPRRMMIPGETFGNVQYGINYLNNPDSVDLGRSTAIFGAGNSAMDVARTAVRKGCRDVTVYVRRNKVAANEDEYELAKIDGVKFAFNKIAIEIKDEGPVICDTMVTEDGKVEILRETAQLVPTDSVVIAVSQVPRHRIVDNNKDLKLNERGNLAVDEEGETTMPGVFASGDVVTGAKTVVHAVEDAKKIADEMDRYMQGLE
ncbi:NAD(P)-dependent oxidoreductase [Absicoccus intestinalis]|uniref:NAD(P)-dependent oxidoreductase n=1 Tax=Absicoccus intestinalis TaxID=2926319 RepID=A0ABU4WLJ4_9FIRM|nr:NAD(P)-dependent oxidoreductase [Absicoccus sp. CLA-KB-P134]MDX8416352.1 NAD(P)-dependent oxidoreductase [Absicoccus sp. CLA-KB-P134]